MIDSQFLVFYRASATFGTSQIMDASIFPNREIGNLSLSAIITFANKHYTCYVEASSNNWIFYNDFPESTISNIGSYEKMIEYSHYDQASLLLRIREYPSPLRNGVLYFYT